MATNNPFAHVKSGDCFDRTYWVLTVTYASGLRRFGWPRGSTLPIFSTRAAATSCLNRIKSPQMNGWGEIGPTGDGKYVKFIPVSWEITRVRITPSIASDA